MYNKIKAFLLNDKLQYICFDMFIFMVCSGIIMNLYSDNVWLATFGGLMAVFGTTPITDAIYTKTKSEVKAEVKTETEN